MVKKKSGVVLVVKNEADDIACWLAWYYVLGFDTCIVFDDDSTDGTWEILQRAAAIQDIRLSRTVGPRSSYFYERQQICYREAITKYKDEFEWLAFFDADEFLSFTKDIDIARFLENFDDVDGIVVNWCNYGSSGHALKPKTLAIEAYTWHGDAAQPINRHVKSIVRPDKIGLNWKNVHYLDIDPLRYVDASHNHFGWSAIKGVIDRPPDWSVAKLMHFQCRSMEHFVERLRKRPELPARVELWRGYDVNQVEDQAPLRLISALQEQITRFSLPVSSKLVDRKSKVQPSRNELVAKLWRGRDPFSGFPQKLYELDTQGWGSTHNFLVQSFEELKPKLIVEIGVWKGASTIAMASRLRDLGLEGTVLAVDTWLGAWDHWINDEWFEHLGWDHGYPSINRKFMANVVSAGLQDKVVPLPLDSLNSAQVLNHLQISVDMLHLDGAHDFESVAADLRVWWPLLRPGGLLIGDDYYEHTHWPGVKQAFDEFFGSRRSSPLENAHGKCRVWKGMDE